MDGFCKASRDDDNCDDGRHVYWSTASKSELQTKHNDQMDQLDNIGYMMMMIMANR